MTRYRGFLSIFSLLLLVLFVSSLAWAKPDQGKPPSWFNQPPLLQTDPVSTDETTLDVFITDEGIFPPILTISPGMTIRWTNQTSQTQHLAGNSTSRAITLYLPLIFKNSANQGSSPISGESANSSSIPSQETNWQSGEMLPGDSFSLVFNQSGEYPYVLTNSPSLSGTIVVESFQVAGLGASNLTVTTTDDELNNINTCSLREAIIAANTNQAVGGCPAGSSYEDTIILSNDTYKLTLSGKNEDAAATGDLDIKSKIKIIGPDNGRAIIDASGLSDRVFHILSYGTATIYKVTIQKGSETGGGIYNAGTLTLDSTNILSNTTGSSFGGGFKNDGNATVKNSVISGNSASYGGGIYNRGTLSLNNTTVSGNTANNLGGGIKNQGTLKLNNSTISNNNAGDGGGVLNYNYGQTKYQNTIIAGNTAGASQRADCAYFSSGSLGFNLVSNGTGCPTVSTDLNIDRTQILTTVLYSLQNNGGNTLTHALRPNSPAIDAGNPNGCKDSSGVLLTSDQRGEKRPVDGNNDTISYCDIGAYETQITDPVQTGPIFTVNTTADPGDGVCTVANCSLREAINAANANTTADEIRFNIPSGGPQVISPTTTLPVITGTLKIDGSTQPGYAGAPIITLDGSLAGPTTNGLDLNAGNSAIRNLTIHNFGGDGIRVTGAISNTTILSNTIFNNGGLGIDLSGDGVTPNDADDPDVGPNNLQNFPFITGAFPQDGGGTLIDGLLNGAPTTAYTLEFFTNLTCDPSNYGEGETFLSTLQVTTDASGDAIFTGVAFSKSVPLGQFVTVTATGPGGTSEFSRCMPVSEGNDSWPTAMSLNPTAVVNQFLDTEGQSRWYKFAIQPNSQVIVTLTGLTSTVLPANYDLTIYKDIRATYNELLSPTTGDLVQLNAEFASDAFASDAIARASRSPDALARASRSPDAFAAAVFSPDAIARASRSPDALARASRSPDAFAADAFAPDAYSADALARASRSPDEIARASRSPETFSSAQTLSLIGVSAFEGNSGEGLVVNTWNNTGDFYVRVKGRNGAFSLDAPFQLEVSLETGACGAVSASGLPATSLTPANDPNSDGQRQTIILTDLTRMEGTDEEKATLQTRLATFAARSEVAGIVVNVGSDDRVAAANRQADGLSPYNPNNVACPYAKNLVAESIKAVIDRYGAANRLAAYVVIVGNDDVIPFFRYPDRALLGPESDYVPPVFDSTSSQASLKLDYVLGQDEYGSQVDLSLQVSKLPIPDLAVGRLVETAADVTHMLDTYLLTSNGVVSPSSGLVTGYDFFADAAAEIQQQLESGLGVSLVPTHTLITARDVSPLDPSAWTADDLRARLLGSRHDVIFLGGHFSASSALAANYDSRLLSTEVASSTVNLENALIFSIGCHSGYNIVNDHGIPGVTAEPDWAQTFARKGATFIGGTGYQYGDTDFLEYSERIYLEFSRQLRTGSGGVSVGQALVNAKQIYLAQTPQLRPMHEKSLLEATLFGLPMLSINMPGARLSPPSDSTIITSVSDAPGATLGLKTADVSLGANDIDIDPSIVQLQDVDALNTTVDALYLSINGKVLSNPNEPILPLLVRNVTTPAPGTLVLRGVGFREGNYADTPNVRALTGAPTTEIRGVHIPFLSDIFYPVQPWSVNYFDALANGGTTTRLAVTPAQFISTSPGSETNKLRQYSGMNFRLYYSDNTATINGYTPALASAPIIAKVSAPITPTNVVNFKVRVVGDPVAGIQGVWVTYTSGCLANAVCSGTWQSLDLTQSTEDSTLWTGTLNSTDPANVRYLVQAVNGVGLVSMVTNMGAYYIPGVDETQLQATALSLDTPASTSGPYGTEVTFSAVLRDNNNQPLSGQAINFGLGSQSGIGITGSDGRASAKIPLLGTPDDYDVRAAFPGSGPYAASAAPNTFQFKITKQETNLCLELLSDSKDNGCTPPAGDNALLVATLKDATGRRLFEKNVIFVVTGSGSFSQSVTVITDFLGRAPLGKLQLPPGDYTVKAYFNGNIPLSTGQTISLDDVRYNPSSQTASLTLINISPVAGNDAYEVNEDTMLNVPAPGVLGNDSDVDSPAITAVLATGPSHGILTLNLNGSFSYTPTANFNGLDSFTYRASDGNSFSNVATVTLTIKPVNDAPVAVNDTYSVKEGSVLAVSATGVLSNDIDVDLNPLTAILVTGPSKGTLTLNSNGSFTYKPPAKFYGTDSFTYKANDGTLNSNIAIVTIIVNPTICSTATANPITIWPPDKDLWVPDSVNVSNSVAVTITRIFQDEPIGKGKYSPDGYILGPNSVKIRAERDGSGDGRVYHLQFTAMDTQGSTCSGEVLVGIVPHDQNGTIGNVDSGPPYYDSKTGAVIP